MTGERLDGARDARREKINEWLAGIAATREGLLDFFYIEGPGDTSIIVEPTTVDANEVTIRLAYSRMYPDLLDVYEQDRLAHINGPQGD